MRPTKLTSNLLEAFRAVLTDELAAIAFTEEELVWQANQRLQPDDQISYRTYQRYKAFFEECHAEPCRSTQDSRHKTQDLLQEVPPPSLPLQNGEEHGANVALVEDMYNTFKGALLKQKLALVRGIYEGQPNWRRYTWMLERKFPDFKLRALPTERLPHKEKARETAPETKEERKLALEAAEGKKKRLAWEVKKAAEMEAAKPKSVADKWERCRGYLPWKPYRILHYRHDAAKLYALEDELAADIAAGYIDPYAHLGYRPDTERHETGFYNFYGMGEDKLPLRVYMNSESREPDYTERPALWEAQERKNQRARAMEQGLELPEGMMQYPPEAEVDEDDPTPERDPDAPSYNPTPRGRILGSSAGYVHGR
ncbi:hypothetical protein BH09BAC1_BH09BAC1_19090 [soil metagenome]